MNNENNFETFLLIEKKKISLSIIKNDLNDKLYEKEFVLDKEIVDLNLIQLEKFLSFEILKIEKYLKKFIKKIVVIIDYQEPFKIKLSLKKKNYGNLLNYQNLILLLKDARSQIKENHSDKIIAHMVIGKYLVDDKFFLSYPNDIKCENLSLEINFICFSKDLLKEMKRILSEYHIEIKQILSASYIKSYFESSIESEKMDIFSKSQKIIDGFNDNEILLTQKNKKNQGFFEKFFSFFS